MAMTGTSDKEQLAHRSVNDPDGSDADIAEELLDSGDLKLEFGWPECQRADNESLLDVLDLPSEDNRELDTLSPSLSLKHMIDVSKYLQQFQCNNNRGRSCLQMNLRIYLTF